MRARARAVRCKNEVVVVVVIVVVVVVVVVVVKTRHEDLLEKRAHTVAIALLLRRTRIVYSFLP